MKDFSKSLVIVFVLILVLSLNGCLKPPTIIPKKPDTKTSINIKIPIGSSSVYVNGEEVSLDSPPAYIDETSQTTMVPLRFISEIIGAKVEWIPEVKEIVITQNQKVIRMTIKNNIATLNGKEFELQSPPQIIQEKAFVPLKFIAQNLDFITDWNPDTKTIILFRNN